MFTTFSTTLQASGIAHLCFFGFFLNYETEASSQYVAATTTLPVLDRLTWCNTCSSSVWRTYFSINKQGKRAMLKHSHFST